MGVCREEIGGLAESRGLVTKDARDAAVKVVVRLRGIALFVYTDVQVIGGWYLWVTIA